MSKIIMITSGKGGVGKTTVCAALGAVLSENSHKVLLVDGDLGLRDLDLALGVQDEVFYTSSDVWNKECLPNEAIINIKENLDFLPASQLYRWEDVKRKKLGKIIKKQRANYDFIIIDSPAGIGRGMESLIAIVDEFCIVVEGNWMALRDAQRVIQFLREHDVRNYHIVLNKVEKNIETTLLEPCEVAEVVGVDYLAAVIPFDKKVIAAGHNGEVINFFVREPQYTMLKPLIDGILKDEVYEIEDILNILQAMNIEDDICKTTDIEKEEYKEVCDKDKTLKGIRNETENKVNEEVYEETKLQENIVSAKKRKTPSIARRNDCVMWKWGRRGRR